MNTAPSRLFIVALLSASVFPETAFSQLSPVLNWTQRISNVLTPIQCVANNGNVFLAGSTGQGLQSADGQMWEGFGNQTFSSLTYANGTWVAVDSARNNTLLVASSGGSWVIRQAVNGGGTFRDVTFGNGAFVATGAAGQIARSTDGGGVWKIAPSPTGYDLNAITFASGQFVAIDVNGNVIRSIDGLYWTLVGYVPPSSPSISYFGITYGNGAFMVAGGANGSSGQPVPHISKSIDGGVSWQAVLNQNIGSSSLYNRIRFHNGRFIAVSSSARIVSSIDDGANWSGHAPGIVGISLRDVTYSGGTWVVVGSNGVILTATENGILPTVPQVTMSPAIRLDWQTQSGSLYEVQSSEDMGLWSPAGAPFYGDGGQGLFYERQNVAAKFYRIIVR